MGRKPKKDRSANDRISPAVAIGDPDRPAAWAVCGLLLLAVAVVFGPTLGYGLVNYDDTEYVSDNPHLANGLSVDGVVWAFTSTRCANWHPLTWLSYLADSQVYGLKPWGYHLTNVLLHAAASILLFLVLWRMTGDLWPSAFVAAVFAIHPLRVESVVWVAERKDVLSGLFFMLTLAAYVGYVRRPFSFARYALVLLLFALGLTAKPMLVTLPLVLLLLDYWPLDRLKLGWRPVVEKLPLLALSAASCVATSVAQRATLARFDALPLGSRAANALVACAAYMGQLFYPVGLAVFYPHPGDGLPIGQIAGALLLLAVITAGAAVCWRRCPWLPVGWLWYLGMLVPVIGLVQVGAQSMADRYTYLPQIGLLIGLAWTVKRVLGAWPQRAAVCGVGAAIVLIALMGCTWHQTTYWRTSEALWKHAISCTPPSALAHYNMAVALFGEERFDEAIAEYRQALEFNPDLADAHNGLGVALARRDDFAEAMLHFQAALRIKPDDAKASAGLAAAMSHEGHADEAVACCRNALKTNPENADLHYSLSNALAKLGQRDEAQAECEKALALRPDLVEAHNNLGAMLAERGQIDRAAEHYRKALEINPRYTNARFNLAGVLIRQAHYDEALAEFEQGLAIKPDSAEAHNNLGLLLAGGGRVDEAVAHFHKAWEIDPANVNAHRNLALVLSEHGRIGEAVDQWREVLRLQPENALAREQLTRALATKPEASPRDTQQPPTPQSDHP